MDVGNAGGAKQGKASKVATSPSPTQDALTRLWKGADSSYGHHLEAVAELREQKRREQQSPGPARLRHRKRRSDVPDPGGPDAQPSSDPVAEERRQSTSRDEPPRPNGVSSGPVASLRPGGLNLSALPRSPLGHLKADAVGELLQRAAWDYRETLAENQRLAKTVDELAQRVEELTKQVASLEEVAARRKEPDELARSLLASAQRAAHEERESARREGELILKKAARRADKMDEEVAERHAARLSEITRLEALRDEVSARLRGMLETLASRHGDAGIGHIEADEVATASKR